MKLLESKKFRLPSLYFISDREEIKELPIGVPFIFGDAEAEKHFVRLLEYEILYQSAVKTGYPFNFRKILSENGYKDLEYFGYSFNAFLEPEGTVYSEMEEFKIDEILSTKGKINMLSTYIKDSSVYVDIQQLKNLKIIPTWMDNLEEAIKTNISNFVTFNPYMYNKKLGGMYGGVEMTPPPRNLIIIDISGSIPRGVSATCLTLAKQLSGTFYADILITGSKSTLYEYENTYKLDIETIYEENEMDNDQIYFRSLLEGSERTYNTAIVFGDNDYPGGCWYNEYNENTVNISVETGKKLNKWKVQNLISFHTHNHSVIAGYGRWFSPEKVEHIKDWVKYLN